ncbi:MAG: transcriptional repressor [Gemmatimonadota bacterium]|nr:transcriptional repressor [Gemmatimonadota bacterium]
MAAPFASPVPDAAGSVDSGWGRGYVPSMDADTMLHTILERHGLRRTAQRTAIYRCLRSSSQHPTAEQVHSAVRVEIANVSLATVYKALETLVACGLASKLAYGDEAARYDARTDDHCHTRCLRCGCVHDVAGSLPADLVAGIPVSADFRVQACRVEMIGYCGGCAA